MEERTFQETAILKQNVFFRDLKEETELACMISSSRSFQSRMTLTPKVLCPPDFILDKDKTGIYEFLEQTFPKHAAAACSILDF